MPPSTRLEQVQRMRADGMTIAEVAETLGLSRSWIGHLYAPNSYETTIRLSREAKARRTGTCVDCGATTHYDGKGVAQRCVPCANALRGRRMLGKGKNIEALLSFLSEPRRYIEIRDHLGITSAHAGVLLNRHIKSGLIVRLSRGVYSRVAYSQDQPQ